MIIKLEMERDVLYMVKREKGICGGKMEKKNTGGPSGKSVLGKIYK